MIKQPCAKKKVSLNAFIKLVIGFQLLTVYFSANNQIMAYPTTAFIFIVGIGSIVLRPRAKRSVTKKAIVRNRI